MRRSSEIDSVDELVRVLREPTGSTIRRRRGKQYVQVPAHREVYSCAGGGWAVDYQGGEVAESVVREAIQRGILVDAYAGKFAGAHPGVGYELAPEMKASA